MEGLAHARAPRGFDRRANIFEIKKGVSPRKSEARDSRFRVKAQEDILHLRAREAQRADRYAVVTTKITLERAGVAHDEADRRRVRNDSHVLALPDISSYYNSLSWSGQCCPPCRATFIGMGAKQGIVVDTNDQKPTEGDVSVEARREVLKKLGIYSAVTAPILLAALKAEPAVAQSGIPGGGIPGSGGIGPGGPTTVF